MEASSSEDGAHLCYIRWLFGDAGLFHDAFHQDCWLWDRSKEIC